MANNLITVEQHGGFKKANSWLEKCLELLNFGYLDKYGRKGVEALSQATPKDTGLASSSWSYEIHREPGEVRIEWHNSDIEHGFPIVIGLQYGHATKSGTWVEGVDFINPALRPIFEEIANNVSKEVKRH
jgi:hypothetical protein